MTQHSSGNQSSRIRFLMRTLVDSSSASSVFEIQKAKFQLICGPERLSNTSFSHSSSLLARPTAQ